MLLTVTHSSTVHNALLRVRGTILLRYTLPVVFKIVCGTPLAWNRNSVDKQANVCIRAWSWFPTYKAMLLQLSAPLCMSTQADAWELHVQEDRAVCWLVQACTSEIRQSDIQGD